MITEPAKINYVPSETYDALCQLLEARRVMKARHAIERAERTSVKLVDVLEMQSRQSGELLPLILAIEAIQDHTPSA